MVCGSCLVDIMSDNTVLVEKKNFLSKTECSNFIDFYNSNIDKSFSFRDTFPLNVSFSSVEDNILHECKKYNENILLDDFQIVKWPVGSYMDPHKDPGNDVFAALIYLNDDYVGGETCFENTKVIPETGKLVIFSNHELLHSVNMVKQNIRYTLALWFTKK